MNEYILNDKLNEALNTIDLRMPRAIKMIKRADNIRNRLVKDNNNYLLEYALIEQCYKIAVEFKNEAMKELYNEMIGKSEFKKKKNYDIYVENKDILNYISCGVFPVVITILFILLMPTALIILFCICFA